MKTKVASWASRKLWFSLMCIALSSYALHRGSINGRGWLIFIGAVAFVYLFFQGRIDVHHVKLSAGISGVTIDTQEGKSVEPINHP